MAVLIFLLFVPAVLVVGIIGAFSRPLPNGQRLVLIVAAATLLATPSPGVATITVFPVPLGFLLGTAAVTNTWSEVGSLILAFPVWFAASISATAAVSYFVARYLLSNKSFERTREG